MELRAISSSPWLQHSGVNHAVEVRGGDRVLHVSGQTSTSENGAPLHADDFVAQFSEAWSNLQKVLAEAEMAAANIVRLVVYTMDVQAFMAQADVLVPVWIEAGARPACTLLVELEATAVA